VGSDVGTSSPLTIFFLSAGKANVVYVDLPFDTGADFTYNATIPQDPETNGDETASFVKEPSILEQKASRDTWGRGLFLPAVVESCRKRIAR
jgi:hypothetical protein